MTEEQFQQSIIELAKILGWRVYHTRDSRGSEPGFPDLVLMRRTEDRAEFVVAELKSDRKDAHVSEDQQWWLDGFLGAGAETYVWRPSDWNEVSARLRKAPWVP